LPDIIVPESSSDQYPIVDEPTQELAALDDSSDALSVDGLEQSSVAEGIPPRIGDYLIHRQIGAGGMGQVFLAEHVRMQRIVAVKTLQFDRMQNPTAIERFYDEIRTASRLMHPNIVTAFDAGEAEGVHYLAMEYVEGMTLTQVVARHGPLPIGEAASVIRQAALGLLHAHRAGIVHRDVKPGNLMRANDGTIKVLDLGLAQVNAPLLAGDRIDEAAIRQADVPGAAKQVRRLIGTLAYMSPEQLEAPERADARSDIYSLGIVLYFLLAGKQPYTGEYIDVVYGHRHGALPDLMEIRDDVDIHFANIFRRMIAKSPGERYASMDEVIEELANYTDSSTAPLWLTEFSRHQTRDEASTASAGSTARSVSQVLAIDFGMFYAAAATATPTGGVNVLASGENGQMLFRTALASDHKQLLFARNALELRLNKPSQVVHCLPMYIGSEVVDRPIAGRKCPPEVLMGMLLRKTWENAWGDRVPPEATAITIPSVYDQLHRQSILTAARIAGLDSVRLVDRCLAATLSTMIDTPDESISGEATYLDTSADENILFVGITGQALEVAVLRREGLRLHQLATAGHWHQGTLAWLRRLVQLAAEKFIKKHGVDPRQSLRTASGLQIACERAMNSLLLLPAVDVSIDVLKKRLTVHVQRSEWLDATRDLVREVRDAIDVSLERAGIKLSEIEKCVALGACLGLAEVRKGLAIGLGDSLLTQVVDRGDVARGAAACLAGELPGRTPWTLPPRCITSKSIGIVVEDRRGRRRILPIIPRGTSLPARTNRRLTVGKSQTKMTLSLVESSGLHGEDWQTLGRYDCEVNKNSKDKSGSTRMMGFEINVNGLLTVRAQTPGVPGSTRPRMMPEPRLREEDIAAWKHWLDKIM